MKHLLCIITVAFANIVYCQNIGDDVMLHQRVPGYVILSEGDTIKGKIFVSARAKSQTRVWFFEENGKKKTYKAKDKEILGYGFETKNGQDSKMPKWRHFQLKTVDQPPTIFTSKTVFLEVKASGALLLYNYYVQMNARPDELYKHYYFLDGEIFSFEKVTKENFDQVTTTLGNNCSRIRKLAGQLSFYDFDRIVKYYNDCYDDRHGINTSKGENENGMKN